MECDAPSEKAEAEQEKTVFFRIFEKVEFGPDITFFGGRGNSQYFSEFSSARVRGGDTVIILLRICWLPEGLPRI